MVRRKAPAIDAPQSLAEAIDLLEDYAALSFERDRLATDRNAAIAAIHAAHDAAAAPLEQHLKASFNRLKPWWEVARDALTDGKRKSVELGGCLIGTKIDNPSLSLPKGKSSELLISEMISTGETAFIVSRLSLDRSDIIKWLRGPENSVKEALLRWGFSTVQRDQFFIDCIPPKAPATICEGASQCA
jgi:phage host-nuclease inhibitor protein Gam